MVVNAVIHLDAQYDVPEYVDSNGDNLGGLNSRVIVFNTELSTGFGLITMIFL